MKKGKGINNHVLLTSFFSRYLETLIHILKANIGSGLFAMGDAFRNSGLVAGPIGTLFIGFICIYSQHELVSFADAPALANLINASCKLIAALNRASVRSTIMNIITSHCKISMLHCLPRVSPFFAYNTDSFIEARRGRLDEALVDFAK